MLAGRPGSWEADCVRSLLHGAVGQDEAHLLSCVPKPLLVHVDLDEVITDLGVWQATTKRRPRSPAV